MKDIWGYITPYLSFWSRSFKNNKVKDLHICWAEGIKGESPNALVVKALALDPDLAQMVIYVLIAARIL